MADAKRRSARQLAERKRSIYFEPDTDEFEEADSENEAEYRPEPAASPARPQRPRKKQKQERRSKPVTRSKEKQRQRFAGRPRKKLGLNSVLPTPSKEKAAAERRYTGPSDNITPDWARLPAEILRQIFTYASQPINEQTTTARSNVAWLIRSARTCRAFAVPALEAFYEFPALHTSLQPHELLDLVTRRQDDLYINYKYRVKSISIDIRRLTYLAHNKKAFQVDALLQQVPRLQSLEIVHPVHSPPYRQSFKCRPWIYPIELFASLKSADIRLKGFRWTRDMIPSDLSSDVPRMYRWMSDLHASKPFEAVERLVVCGYDYKDSALEIPEGAESRSHALATTISTLPALKDLTFVSCDVIMEDFLEHIPRNLERLELSNCLEVTSDMMYNYLETGGSQLKELVLNHNAALNLAFLQHLKVHCPKLEVLEMDFTYYSERFNFNDAIALYDHLLAEDQVPTWPSSLRHLELLQMQKWEASAAQTLFRSLLDSAIKLPELRHLALQAHIDIPWRDRAGFRDQWIERLQRVYLRKQDEPKPNLGSLKQFRLWKQSQGGSKAELQDSQSSESEDAVPLRRKLSHVQVTPRKPRTETLAHSDDETNIERPTRAHPRRSVRVAESQSASTAAEESSSESDDEPGDDWRKQREQFIQGLCDVVDIRIDNQRPRENQYTEANFLDSEPSGDEDYREGAEISDDDRYAW